MAVDAVSSTSNSNNAPTVSPDKTGFNALDSQAFLKLLITQLQNQDPTNPLSNDELLNQLSAMRNLQANLELESSLKSLTLNQQLSSGASFLGKSVAGADANQQQFSGVVDRILVRDGKTYVGIGEAQVPLDQITSVTLDQSA